MYKYTFRCTKLFLRVQYVSSHLLKSLSYEVKEATCVHIRFHSADVGTTAMFHRFIGLRSAFTHTKFREHIDKTDKIDAVLFGFCKDTTL